MMASLASVNPYSGGAQPVRVNHYLNAHHAEISSSLFSLALMLAVPFAPQAVAKTAAATTASQPEIASGSAMIVDPNTNKVI